MVHTSVTVSAGMTKDKLKLFFWPLNNCPSSTVKPQHGNLNENSITIRTVK